MPNPNAQSFDPMENKRANYREQTSSAPTKDLGGVYGRYAAPPTDGTASPRAEFNEKPVSTPNQETKGLGGMPGLAHFNGDRI